MDVELLAVNKISDLIARCPRLKANIAHNDKTPFTDGHIDIYASPGAQAKEDFRGRVPVQVKGRTGLPKDGAGPSFPISRWDLQGHLRDRGVLYFVVYVDPDSARRDPYYAVLSPFKIDELIREAPPEKKRIPVRLQRLPSDPEQLEALLAFAYQSRSEDVEMRASEALLGDIREITIHSANELDIAKPVTLRHTERDFSVVITAADGTKMPADGTFMFAPAEYVGVPTEHIIRSGEFEFRHPVRRRIDEHTVELELSAGLRLRLQDPAAGGGGGISLELQDNLAARHSDVGFFLRCMDGSGFDVDDRTVRYTFSEPEDHEDIRAHHAHLTKLMQLFASLGADASLINLADITQHQHEQLAGLHTALVENQEVTQTFDRPGRVAQPVGEWSVELLCIRGEEPEKWKYIDLFASDNERQFSARVEYENGETQFIRVTPYEILKDEKFARVLNLRLSEVVGAFERVADYPGVASRATAMVLRLIAAADATPLRRAEFLNSAEALNGWIIAKDGSQPPYLINGWQVAARNGKLSPADRAAIRDLRRAASSDQIEMSHYVEISCAILLGDAEDVEQCLGRLTEDEVETLRGWPIWALHERGADELSPTIPAEPEDQARQMRAFRDLFPRG